MLLLLVQQNLKNNRHYEHSDAKGNLLSLQGS